jgi:hypothetical protein
LGGCKPLLGLQDCFDPTCDRELLLASKTTADTAHRNHINSDTGRIRVIDS